MGELEPASLTEEQRFNQRFLLLQRISQIITASTMTRISVEAQLLIPAGIVAPIQWLL